MTAHRFLAQLEQLSDDEVAGIAISAGVKRDGDEWVPSGVDLTAFRRNPVILRDHDPASVIGTATSVGLTADGSAIAIRIQFAPAGISTIADEARGLAKAGILRGISAGVDPIETEPLRNGTRGVCITKSELIEVSLVAAPADSDALITARSFRSRPATMAMLRSLPAVSQRAIDGVLERMRQPRAADRPIGLLSPSERTALYAQEARSRTMATWALGKASEAEARERFSRESRQADLARLSQGSKN